MCRCPYISHMLMIVVARATQKFQRDQRKLFRWFSNVDKSEIKKEKLLGIEFSHTG